MKKKKEEKNKISMKKLLILLLFVPLVSFGQDNIYSITSQDGLNVRNKPGIDGAKIATLLLDDLVYLTSKTDKYLTINDFNKLTGETKEISGQWVRIRTLYPPKLKEKKELGKNSYKNIEGYVFDGFLKILNVTDSIYSKDLIKDNKIYYYQKTPFTGVSITNNENNKKILEEIFLKGFLFKSILVELGLNTERSKQTYYYKSGNIRSESVFVDKGGGVRESSTINFSENGYRINSSSERVKEGDTYADEYYRVL